MEVTVNAEIVVDHARRRNHSIRGLESHCGSILLNVLLIAIYSRHD